MATSNEEALEFEANDSYYGLLNVRKAASQEELKSAYRRSCAMAHPDKHQDEANKIAAQELFGRIQNAYQVLSDPQKRAIYDIYGQKGLEAEWTLVEKTRSPAEIVAEYERIRQEQEERKLQLISNPHGTVQVGFDAVQLFSGDNSDTISSSVEVTFMSIEQSFQSPMTPDLTSLFSGALVSKNGMADGTINWGVRGVTHSGWVETTFGLLGGRGFSWNTMGSRNMSRYTFATLGGNVMLQEKSGDLSIALQSLQASVGRQLGKHTVGFLEWKGPLGSTMTTKLVRDLPGYQLTCVLQVGLRNIFGAITFTKKLEDEGRIFSILRLGVLGSFLSYGGQLKMTKHTTASAMMTVGLPLLSPSIGVRLKIRLSRVNQNVVLKFQLADEPTVSSLLYGSLLPVAAFWLLKRLVFEPLAQRAKLRRTERQEADRQEKKAQQRQDAQAQLRLMQEMGYRIVETETAKRGLIIVKAWYGRLVTSDPETGPSDKVIDVTLPLQCQVKDSKLILTDASKSNLAGFYDPCEGEEKLLHIEYKFLEEVHRCSVADDQPIRIPKKSHKVVENND